jgi:hypothetical protein
VEDDGREMPDAVRVVFAVLGLLMIAAFVALGVLLWANSGDGPCDGPKVQSGCAPRFHD